MRHEHREREHIGLQQRQQAHNDCKQNAVPQHCFENIRLFAELIGCRGCHDDALGINHLAHDAASAVGSANEHLQLRQIEMWKHGSVVDLGCCNLLQTAE